VRYGKLIRSVDESGVSGTGVVAEIVEFSNGMVAVCFLTGPAAEGYRNIIPYWSLDAVERIHGHEGKTAIVWEHEQVRHGYEAQT
jgi:hypothetical protein